MKQERKLRRKYKHERATAWDNITGCWRSVSKSGNDNVRYFSRISTCRYVELQYEHSKHAAYLGRGLRTKHQRQNAYAQHLNKKCSPNPKHKIQCHFIFKHRHFACGIHTGYLIAHVCDEMNQLSTTVGSSKWAWTLLIYSRCISLVKLVPIAVQNIYGWRSNFYFINGYNPVYKEKWGQLCNHAYVCNVSTMHILLWKPRKMGRKTWIGLLCGIKLTYPRATEYRSQLSQWLSVSNIEAQAIWGSGGNPPLQSSTPKN